MMILWRLHSFTCRSYLLLLLAFYLSSQLTAQPSHALGAGLDAPLLGAGALGFGLSIPLQKNVPILTEAEIQQLDPIQIPGIDRIASRQYHAWARQTSDITLRASIVAPFLLLLDRHTRQEAGTAGVLFLETALLTNALTGLTKAGAKRTRPFVYNPDADFPLKMRPDARLSFFSGHTSNAAAFSFFAAKMFADNNPGHRLQPVVWSTAAILPAVTGLLRVKGGKHFPTDVAVGYAVGAVVGILVPELHR